MPRQDLIKLRRGTASEWTTANPVLASGETGYETDSRKSKVGDGVKDWSTLDYTNTDYENFDNTDGRQRKIVLPKDFDFPTYLTIMITLFGR